METGFDTFKLGMDVMAKRALGMVLQARACRAASRI